MSYHTKCTEIITKAQKLLNETDWTFVSNVDDVLLENKYFPDICSVPCFRTTTLVDKSVEYLMDKLWNETEETRLQEDPDIVYWTEVEADKDWRVCNQLNKMQWPFWSRETVYVQVKVVQSDVSWIVTFSVDHDCVPRKDDQYVRATVFLSVYRFSKEGNQTRIHRMSHIDPGGNIPVSIINLYAGKLCKPLLSFKHD